jgi:hypothetical protein
MISSFDPFPLGFSSRNEQKERGKWKKMPERSPKEA